MAAAASATAQKLQPLLKIEDENYGREEYITDCVQKILKGESVLITLGGFFNVSSLPPILQNKYGKEGSTFFPGFRGALSDVIQKVGKEVIVREFRGGSNSDLLGLLRTNNDLDGHFVELAKPQSAAVASAKK